MPHLHLVPNGFAAQVLQLVQVVGTKPAWKGRQRLSPGVKKDWGPHLVQRGDMEPPQEQQGGWQIQEYPQAPALRFLGRTEVDHAEQSHRE